jgi:hypothetical protein
MVAKKDMIAEIINVYTVSNKYQIGEVFFSLCFCDEAALIKIAKTLHINTRGWK